MGGRGRRALHRPRPTYGALVQGKGSGFGEGPHAELLPFLAEPGVEVGGRGRRALHRPGPAHGAPFWGKGLGEGLGGLAC